MAPKIAKNWRRKARPRGGLGYIVRAGLRETLDPPPYRKYGESVMHLDIILLVVLAALAAWTEIDKLRMRKTPRL